MLTEAARLMHRLHRACLVVIGPSGERTDAVTTRDLLRVFLRPGGEGQLGDIRAAAAG